jgi:hypothetical protein
LVQFIVRALKNDVAVVKDEDTIRDKEYVWDVVANRGLIRYRIGSMSMVSRASICSEMRTVPLERNPD